jgi:hypothetical protein
MESMEPMEPAEEPPPASECQWLPRPLTDGKIMCFYMRAVVSTSLFERIRAVEHYCEVNQRTLTGDRACTFLRLAVPVVSHYEVLVAPRKLIMMVEQLMMTDWRTLFRATALRPADPVLLQMVELVYTLGEEQVSAQRQRLPSTSGFGEHIQG